MHKKNHKRTILRNGIIAFLSIGLIISGILVLWLTTLKVPDLRSFENRIIAKSSKVYDRTGEKLLYDFHQDIKRTVIPLSSMSSYVKNATVAIEDSEFYTHNGFRLKSFLRAAFANLTSGSFSQGGSTLTQQIVKNAILTKEKTVIRKIKEIVLALKVERELSKEEILAIYLNEAPYGGNIYGVEEASQTYFDKKTSELSLAEASYLAAIPQAPTFFSPYGKNKARLDERKNTVLTRMKELGFITETEYTRAKNEIVVWKEEQAKGILAPHFVFFVKEYLESKYGTDVIETGGLKITTTLDYKMQEKAEEIVKRRSLENEKNNKAKNAGLVAIDPKTGQILVMVGSRDYFDSAIDGQYNIATARRQPGSAFKPFVYALAFNNGYTPETVLFDVATEFNPGCNAYGYAGPGATQKNCYMPQNYDSTYHGPMSIRSALARSINIPAVKMLYLVGIDNAIKFANDMGIKTLGTAKDYGLTLVLGGGEVRLLDMVSAYGVFAAGGVRHEYTPILKVEDSDGTVLEEYTQNEGTQILPKRTALMISSILSDNVARTPTFGANSVLKIPGHTVAVKTGTTNNYKDAWIVGYTPSLVVGGWTGNNDNTPMAKQISALLVAPTWNEFMKTVLKDTPDETFEDPGKEVGYENLKPVLRGVWSGGEGYTIDTISGKLATAFTPPETRKEFVSPSVHDILYWVNKKDPRGPKPTNPYDDAQFKNWETAVQNWWANHAGEYSLGPIGIPPTTYDDIHTPEKRPIISIVQPLNASIVNKNTPITVIATGTGPYPVNKIDVFLNGSYIGTSQFGITNFTFVPSAVGNLRDSNELRVVGYDTVFNSNESSITLNISE